jgi:hypothetical protein
MKNGTYLKERRKSCPFTLTTRFRSKDLEAISSRLIMSKKWYDAF